MRILERWRAWRALRRCAPLAVDSPEGSHVKVSGVVRVLDETVIAPLSGRECVFVRSRIRGTGYVGEPPKLLQIKPFVLETQAGEPIVVDGGEALLGIPPVKLSRANIGRELAFIVRFAIKPPASAWLEEIVIAAGDRITVGGVVMHDLNPEPPTSERVFRQGHAPRLRLVGNDDYPLVIVADR